MKVGIISDIHSNYEALSVALDWLDAHDIEEITCLGDVVGYGADPNPCCQLIRESRSSQAQQSEFADRELHFGAHYVARQTVADIADCIGWQNQVDDAFVQYNQGYGKHPPIGLVVAGPLAAIVIQSCYIVAKLTLQKVDGIGATD